MKQKTQKCGFFCDISKIEAQEDGTVIIEGIASTESVDADGEVIKADAMRNALPDFMRYGTGNLREMHQLNAVGTIESAEVDAEGRTVIVAKVVDSEAVRKVHHGVYKGFSVQGRSTGRDAKNRKVITGLRLSEMSLVDRPNNPDTVFTIRKVDDPEGLLEQTGLSIEQLTKVATEEATRIMKNNPIRKAFGELSANTWLAHTVAGLDVIKAHTGGEWIGDDNEAQTQLKEGIETISKALTSLGRPGADDIQKVLKEAEKVPEKELFEDIKKAAGSIPDSVTFADYVKSTFLAHDEVIKAFGAAGCKEGQSVIEFLSAMHEQSKKLADDVKKVEQTIEAYGLPKETPYEDFITKVFTELKELKSQPRAGGPALRHTVSKADDTKLGGASDKSTETTKTAPTQKVEDVVSDIKKIHAAGGEIVTGF